MLYSKNLFKIIFIILFAVIMIVWLLFLFYNDNNYKESNSVDSEDKINSVSIDSEDKINSIKTEYKKNKSNISDKSLEFNNF